MLAPFSVAEPWPSAVSVAPDSSSFDAALMLRLPCASSDKSPDDPIFPDFNPQSLSDVFQFLVYFQFAYARLIAETIYLLATNSEVIIHGLSFSLLKYGLSFSLSLLAILTAHEAGHYIAARLYRVDATLPYFIPTPLMVGPAGTLGAFIKILSPLPSRRATFDIGVAGPIAGFVMLIPVAIIGFLTMQHVDVAPGADLTGTIYFSDPLLLKGLAYLLGHDLSLPIAPNPFYAAAWLGLLVTSLNLIPSGQLDGGHAVFSVFGERTHFWMGRAAFVVMVATTTLGWFLYNSPSGLLFTLLLAVMMRIRHPQPLDDTPLDLKRKAVAVLTLLIFILSFVPFPIQIK